MRKISKPKAQIDSLKNKDPEFYKFLEENDTQILNFGEGGNDEDLEIIDDAEQLDDNDEVNHEYDEENDLEFMELDQDDVDTKETTKPPNKQSANLVSVEITIDMFNAEFEKAKSGSHAAIKKILAYFKAACMPTNIKHKDDG